MGEKSLKQLYREQLDSYPSLSQEEIVALYESEGITSETTEELIKKLDSLIWSKKRELDRLKDMSRNQYFFNSVFRNNEIESKAREIESFLEALEEHTIDLENSYRTNSDDVSELAYYLQEVYYDLKPMFSTKLDEHIGDLISNLIEDINLNKNDISTKIQELFESVSKRKLQAQKELEEGKKEPPTTEELEKEIETLEKKLQDIKYKYKNYGHKLFVTTRGYTPRDRTFPSAELRNKIVCGCLGFAKYWAKVYYYKADNTTPFDDLLQIAYMSLISAAHYYIPNEKAKFTTYARRCMENKLKQEVYSKRKMKKRPYKAENFFDEEKVRLRYAKMFAETLKYKGYSGGVWSDYKETSSRSMLETLRRKLLDFNREIRLTGDTDKLLPSYTNKHLKNDTESLISETIQRIVDILKQSKLPLLINDEDRYFANLITNYENKSPDVSEICELIFFLDTYLMKIETIELYLEVEKELKDKNNGIAPTDEELFEAINMKIKSQNREKTKLKKSGFYNFNPNKRYNRLSERTVEDSFETTENMIEEIKACQSEKIVLFLSYNPLIAFDSWEAYEEGKQYRACKIYSKEVALKKLKATYNSIPSWETIQSMSYTPLDNYYDIYMSFYSVDPFISPEEYEKDGLISKQKEYDDILKSYDEASSLLEIINIMIGEIESADAEEIILSTNDYLIYDSWKVYIHSDDILPWEKNSISKEEALNELYLQQSSLLLAPTLTKEEFLQFILKQRRDKVNTYLKESNAPKYEHNKEIAINRLKYNKGYKSQRLLKEREFDRVQSDINLLYENDDELMLLLTSHKRNWSHYINQSTEEEAISNAFMQDYYQALENLPELEKEVLKRYFDENGIHSIGAKEIGAELGITERKVYQIKTKALKRLSKNTKLQSYNED